MTDSTLTPLAAREYWSVVNDHAFTPNGARYPIRMYVELHPDSHDLAYLDGAVEMVVGIRWAVGQYIDEDGVEHSGEFEYALTGLHQLLWEHELCDP